MLKNVHYKPNKGKKMAKSQKIESTARNFQFAHTNLKKKVQGQLNFTQTHICVSVTFRNYVYTLLKVRLHILSSRLIIINYLGKFILGIVIFGKIYLGNLSL